MLKKQNRLKSSRAYNATYKNECIVSDSNLVLYAGKIKDDVSLPTRVGFVVSKKIHKRAVIRNRIKRLIRENIRLLFKNSDSKLNKFVSLIFLARTNILNKDMLQINNSIVNLLDKITNKKI